MKFWLSVFLVLTILGITNAQTATVSGLVADAKTKEPLIGVAVYITGSTQGTITDLDGKFTLKLSPGTYNFSASYVSYKIEDKKDIKVGLGNTTVNFYLQENAVQMEGVVVMARRKTDTDISTLSSVKTSLQIVSGISSQLISKSLDRDASEAVKRIPGISIMDNRFIVVRGLNQRYNNVWLNDAPTPSSETDQKAFSFDVLPAKMIDNIMIYKTAAPELTAEATGGFIKVYTKNMPDRDFVEVEIGGSFKEGTSFKPTFQLPNGNLDFLGFDNGARAIPSTFPSNLNDVSRSEIDKLSTQLNNNWVASQKTALPGGKIQFNIGKRWDLKDRLKLGMVSSVNYGYDYTTKNDMLANSYETYDFNGDKPVFDKEYVLNSYSSEANINLLSNWALHIGSRHQIEFKNLFTQVGENTTSLLEGYNNYRIGWFKYQNHLFSSRSVYSGQFSGNHRLGLEDDFLDWNVSYSYANRREPDRKVWGQKLNSSTGKYEYLIPSASSINELGRLWLNNDEHLVSAASNYVHNFELGDQKSSLLAGVYGEYKYRNYSERSFCYQRSITGNITDDMLNSQGFEDLFTDTYLGLNKAFYLKEETGFENLYDANTNQMAFYLAWSLPLGESLKFHVGARGEFYKMQLNGYSDAVTPVYVDNAKLDIFPSGNLTYSLDDKNLVRLAYGYTINRAEFREIAPLKYYDFASLASYFGNPNLKNSYIHNVDLRYEYYPSLTETVSFALFYKQFKDPIEMVHLVSSGENYTFDNADKAMVLGAELELKKSLAFMSLKNFGFQFNATYVHSKVEFAGTNHSESDRALQGQSPYLINTGLYYTNEKLGLSASALYNLIGKRMLAAGMKDINGDISSPDVYEMPRNVLDIVVTKQLGKRFQLKFGVKDLLNQPYRCTQTFNGLVHGVAVSREVDTRLYTPGRTYALSVTMKF